MKRVRDLGKIGIFSFVLVGLVAGCGDRKEAIKQPPVKQEREIVQKGLETSERIAATFMKKHDYWQSYPVDLGLESLLHLYEATSNPSYLEHVLKVWRFRKEDPAKTLNWKIMFTNLHWETYAATKNRNYVSRLPQVAIDFKKASPKDRDGAATYPNDLAKKQIFIDMLCGYAVMMSRAGELGGDASFFDECVGQYVVFRKILRDPTTGLWHHGRVLKPTEKIYPHGWARGQGWVLRGMVDSLECIPKSHPKRVVLRNMLEEFASDLVKYQDANGMWHQMMHEPDTYPETTGTGFVVYYLFKAMWMGDLDKRVFLGAAQKGALALTNYVDENGAVSNACAGTPLLEDIEEYRHRPCPKGEMHGVGTVMMGCLAPALAEKKGVR